MERIAMEMKRRKRSRPPVLTLILLLAITGTIILSNLTFERSCAGPFRLKSYGWPLICHRYVIMEVPMVGICTVGWYYSAGRLAANAALWSLFLAAPGAASEWLLRRYRPRLRWNLKAQLGCIALVASLCSWLSGAHRRADVQDVLIEELEDASLAAFPHPEAHVIFVQRWGPKWLDLLGADRYRRRVVAVKLGSERATDSRIVAQLARLRDLRCLSCEVDQVRPAMAAVLNEMRGLQRLKLVRRASDGTRPGPTGALLPPIGGMTGLRELEVDAATIGPNTLAGLVNVKSLRIGGRLRGEEDHRRPWPR